MADDLKQFKSLTDLSTIIEDLGAIMARPIEAGAHPTLYPERREGKYRTVMGIRVCDYKFSPDLQWVLPDDQMGLSFSATWQSLEFVYKLIAKHRDKPLDVYWVLSGADIPSGLAFVADRGRAQSARGHYFLTVTETMKVSSLVEKLQLVAYRMSVIHAVSRVL